MQEVYSSSWSISVTGAEGFSLCCTQTAGTTKSMAYSQRLGSDADINAGSKPQFKRTYFKYKFKNYLLITQYIQASWASISIHAVLEINVFNSWYHWQSQAEIWYTLIFVLTRHSVLERFICFVNKLSNHNLNLITFTKYTKCILIYVHVLQF